MTAYRAISGGQVTIVIADEDALAREGLKSMLHSGSGCRVIAEAYELDPLISLAAEKKPDLIVCTTPLWDKIGLALMSAINEQALATKVLLMGTTAKRDTILQALQAGAVGYVPKSSTVAQWEEACFQARRGGSPVLPGMAADLLLYVLEQQTLTTLEADTGSDLTRRQDEVLRLMVRGLSNKEIAHELTVSETTVKSHVTGILRKLGVSDRTQAVVKAIREQLIPGKDMGGQTG